MTIHGKTSGNIEMTETNEQIKPNRFVRWLLITAGTVALSLGILGIILPLLPTTPFLLLAAASYARGSKKFYNWLMDNRFFGKYIKNYREGKGIPLKVKISAIAFLWTTILITAFFFIPVMAVKILLIAIAAGVTVHIVKIHG
ncbi:MAG: YbaN family protein [Spirochaetales bacterium]|nr:YbaN family protein [Spirochaetales bacterium]